MSRILSEPSVGNGLGGDKVNGQPMLEKNTMKLPMNERMRLWRKTQELRKQGLGSPRIAKKIGIRHSTVRNWVYGGKRPDKNVIIEPNLNPSPELARLIGIMWSDGSLFKSGEGRHLITIAVKDKEYAEVFNNCLEAITGRRYAMRKYRLWAARASNKGLYNFLKDPEQCKLVIGLYPSDFLIGFYDGDGWPEFRTRPHIRCSVVACGNKKRLEFVRETLVKHFNIYSNLRLTRRRGEKIIIKGNETKANEDQYNLEILRKTDVLRFAQKVGFGISRKRETLGSAVSEIKDAEISSKRKTPIIDGLVPKMRELRSMGFSYKKIGAELGVSTWAVWTRLHGGSL